jgi:hypothetical protein
MMKTAALIVVIATISNVATIVAVSAKGDIADEKEAKAAKGHKIFKEVAGATKLSYTNTWEETDYQGELNGAGGRIETYCTNLFRGHELQGDAVGTACFNDFLDFTSSGALYVDESANYYFPGMNPLGDSLSYRLAFQSQTCNSNFPNGLVLDQKFTSGSGKFWDSYQSGSLHLEVGVMDNIRRITFRGVKL